MRKVHSKKPHLITNRQIKGSQIRIRFDVEKYPYLISSFNLTNGHITDKNKVLEKLYNSDLDLILINTKTSPPICLIENVGRYQFMQNKKAKNNGAKTTTKSLRIGLNTSPNDLNRIIRQAQKFLEKKQNVKLSLRLKGREHIFADEAELKILRIAKSLSDYGSIKPIKKTKSIYTLEIISK